MSIEIQDNYLDDVQCGICHNLLRQPAILPSCGHVFDALCIERWALEQQHRSRSLTGRVSCPTCVTISPLSRIIEQGTLSPRAIQAANTVFSRCNQYWLSAKREELDEADAALDQIEKGIGIKEQSGGQLWKIQPDDLPDSITKFLVRLPLPLQEMQLFSPRKQRETLCDLITKIAKTILYIFR